MYLGIDLGTTFSVGAYVDGQGCPHTVTNSEGENTTPSVVYFESADSVVVGQAAKDNSELFPKNVVSLVKNSMGKQEKYVTDHGEYTPEAVSAYILKKIVSDANKALGLTDSPIKDVVVTIPAYFTDPQRKATEQAIAIAGLNCLGLINEPTAAAYYYASGSKLENADILVYDLGGGTFDATVIHVNGRNIKVVSTGGLPRVGGSFFDRDIAGYVADYIREAHGIDLKDPKYVSEYQELLGKAERAKIQLSSSERARIAVKVDNVRESVEITRETFNGMIDKLYKSTVRVVNKALKDAGLTPGDIEKTIMVGGSSRIPYIEENLKKDLKGLEPSHEVNPDEVVALGAALYAKSLLEDSKGTTSGIVDVCSHGIGITAYNEKEDCEYNDILIDRNTAVPAEAHRLYKLGEDGQREITITVNEGDFKELTDVSEICTVPVQLPSKLSKGTQIDIRIGIDRDQLMHIYLRLPNQGNVESEVTFDRKANLSEVEISKWRKSMAKGLASLEGRKVQDNVEESAEENKTGLLQRLVGALQKDADDKTQTLDHDEKKEKKNKKSEYPKIIENSVGDLLGLKSVKDALRNYYNLSENAKKRMRVGASDEVCRNFVILGVHGMGMTTAAETVAQTLEKFGVSNGKTEIADYDTLYDLEVDKVRANIETVFQNAMGGVLIIDNFEEFCSDDMSDPGPKIVDMIKKAYDTAGGQVALVIAGEREPLEALLKKKRKFSELFGPNDIVLEGFTPEEYRELLHRFASGRKFVVDKEADSLLERFFKGEKDLPDFEYINSVKRVLDDAITNRANELQDKRHVRDVERMMLTRENFVLNAGGRTLDEALAELDGLTGLKSVKEEVHKMVDELKADKMAVKAGQQSEDKKLSRHMLFMGNPGTGKTTVARIIGDIMRELEILPRGGTVEVSRDALVGEYQGHTAPKTQKVIDSAMGGVLFIDEAYSLCKGDGDVFGQEAVDTLVKRMDDDRGKLVVILAGYTKEMTEFLKTNSGLSSRFSRKITFEDYSIDEMMEIFERNVRHNDYVMEDGMKEAVRAVLEERVRTEDDFGNARGVRNLYEEIVANHKSNVAKLSKWDANEAKTLRKADIGKEIEIIEHPKTVEELLAELNSLTGLASVKRQINAYVNTVRVNKLRKTYGSSVGKIGGLHMVFAGNPGTGKTTVARLVGSIMKGLGILPKGHCEECDRAKLVAGYQGQTAIKTQKVIDSAMGGVLFIDEAYSLYKGKNDEFGSEAIDTLVKALDDHNGEFMCIAAGYKDEMKDFIDSNIGLSSRFTHVIDFEDYSVNEMCEMFMKRAAKEGYSMEEGVMDSVRKVIEKSTATEDQRKRFGNGRGVRNLFNSITSNLDSRLATSGPISDTAELMTIRVQDVQ